ncbi:MAG: hypothetical protein K9I29_02610 [Bacteroidales bacterium]|nr:hypothetical protein [Bacteroidales bacterium]MCF8327159.1 hypothetical protein [Bacteroidales bacterium]
MKCKFFVLISSLLLIQSALLAQGISTDAGLTPAQDRWIVRSQYRIMGMENSSMEMSTRMIPVVLGYGITPAFSIMARGMYMRKSITNNNKSQSGINDPFLLSKFRLYRKNTAKYTLGIAPYIASNVPVGDIEISSRTWNPEVGLNISFRPRFLAVDISSSYVFYDAGSKLTTENSNKYNLNMAFSGKIPLITKQILSPVLEFNYFDKGKNNNSAGAVKSLFISPGLIFMHSSLSLEALYQIPVYESDETHLMDQKSRIILGIKYMF